jgi:hypothetical protein
MMLIRMGVVVDEAGTRVEEAGNRYLEVLLLRLVPQEAVDDRTSADISRSRLQHLRHLQYEHLHPHTARHYQMIPRSSGKFTH